MTDRVDFDALTPDLRAGVVEDQLRLAGKTAGLASMDLQTALEIVRSGWRGSASPPDHPPRKPGPELETEKMGNYFKPALCAFAGFVVVGGGAYLLGLGGDVAGWLGLLIGAVGGAGLWLKFGD